MSKLRTSNFAHIFSEQSECDPLKLFKRGHGQVLAALNANSLKKVKATNLKFDRHVPINSPDMTP